MEFHYGASGGPSTPSEHFESSHANFLRSMGPDSPLTNLTNQPGNQTEYKTPSHHTPSHQFFATPEHGSRSFSQFGSASSNSPPTFTASSHSPPTFTASVSPPDDADPEIGRMQQQMKALERDIGERRRRLADSHQNQEEVAQLVHKISFLERENEAMLRRHKEQEQLILELRQTGANQKRELAEELDQAKACANKYYLDNRKLVDSVSLLQEQIHEITRSVGKRLGDAEEGRQQLIDAAIVREQHVNALTKALDGLSTELEESKSAADTLLHSRHQEVANNRGLSKLLLAAQMRGDEGQGGIASKLLEAAASGDLQLLDRCLDPSSVADHSLAPFEKLLAEALCTACKEGHVKLAEQLLLRFEFDIDQPITLGDTAGGAALHYAIRANSEQMMRLLLPQTRKIDQSDNHQQSCLHLAVLHTANPAHVRMLLRCGASPEVVNRHGLTPMQLVDTLEPPRADLKQSFEHPGVKVWNCSRRAARLFEEQQYPEALKLFNAAVECGPEALAEELSQTAVGLLYKNRAEVALQLDHKQHWIVVESCTAALGKLSQRSAEYVTLREMRAASCLELCDFEMAVDDLEELTVLVHQVDEMENWCEQAGQAKLLRDASHYDVLCVSEEAEFGAIKKAFYKLSKQWHPDKHLDSEDGKIRSTRMFQRVSDAYSVLSDDDKRIHYDSELAMKRAEDQHDSSCDVSFSSDLSGFGGGVTPRSYEWYMSQMHQQYFESFFEQHDKSDDDDDY